MERALLLSCVIIRKEKTCSLRNVFIVTAGERPYYASQFPQVIWVNDTEFLPENIVPTFSSVTIEFGLVHLLPRLSDPFITMNDDWFIRNNLDLNEFVRRRTWYRDRVTVQDIGTNRADPVRASILNTDDALSTVFPNYQREQHTIAHLPTVVRHDTLLFLFRNVTQAFNDSLTRFRTNTTLQFQYALA